MSRLSTGGLIDRDRPLTFRFDGRSYHGFAGDTLASALVANDVRLVGRSFKYHRPRGLMTAGPEEPNGLVTLGRGAGAEPNTRATAVPLTDGLEAFSQNRWPSLGFDLMAVNGLLAPLFPAGFYYKTFMWPAAFWEKLYEPIIRRAAGLGRLPALPDPNRYDRSHAFCDLLVIGAGPAGLAAALAAARAGLRVVLVERDDRLGGRLLAERHEIDGAPAIEWVRATEAELATLGNVTILRRTTLFGAYDGGVFAAVEEMNERGFRQRYWKIRARRSVLATGAVERPLLFAGNDLPGVMLASAVQCYANRFAALPGAAIAVLTSSDSGWSLVDDLRTIGVSVTAVVETRATAPAAAAQRAIDAGARVFAGAMVTEASGRRRLKALRITDASGREERLAVDTLAMAGGWNPAIGIASHLGGRPVWADRIGSFVMNDPPPGMTLVGAATGVFTLADALSQGLAAGCDAARDLGKRDVGIAPPGTSSEASSSAPPRVAGGVGKKAFVDFQHDVTVDDVALAVREGFTSIEHLKRYTTLGMATDQGKTSQVNGHMLLAAHGGRAIEQTGTVLSRPPFLPVPIGVLAGAHRDEHFRPTRLTAAHCWAAEQGASFVDIGEWKRAQWFVRPGEAHWRETVDREVRTVREHVGICDVSTLGKIEICGPDGGALLDRLYANMMSSLAVGRARYGIMLREDGFVLDDGVVSRLGEHRWFLTTTTANAGRVMQHVNHACQVLWPDLDVAAVSVTEQWAQFAVAGPASRALLRMLLPDHDLANAAFPFMSALQSRWRDVPMRLFRVSFSGELAYEVAVPADYGTALAEALMACGQSHGVTPYGTEALGVLRIEKGHAAGGELNGQTTAGDLGLGGMMSTKKDFIGRVMAGRPGLVSPDRAVLVGIKPLDRSATIRSGAHLLDPRSRIAASSDLGHVTSSAFSPTLGHSIGLALVARGRDRLGEQLRLYDPVRNGDMPVELCSPVFYDPEGERVRG